MWQLCVARARACACACACVWRALKRAHKTSMRSGTPFPLSPIHPTSPSPSPSYLNGFPMSADYVTSADYVSGRSCATPLGALLHRQGNGGGSASLQAGLDSAFAGAAGRARGRCAGRMRRCSRSGCCGLRLGRANHNKGHPDGDTLWDLGSCFSSKPLGEPLL